MSPRRPYGTDSREQYGLNNIKPIVITDIKPVEKYDMGNFRIYLDRMFENGPAITVKACVNGQIVTVTNRSANGLLSVIGENGNKKQVDDSAIILFDRDTVYQFQQCGLETGHLTRRTGEPDEDISGVRSISDETLRKLTAAKKT